VTCIGCLMDQPPIKGGSVRTSLPTPSLHTARLRLRAFDDTDANGLFALHSSPYVLRYWDAPPWSERARISKLVNTGETTGWRIHGPPPAESRSFSQSMRRARPVAVSP